MRYLPEDPREYRIAGSSLVVPAIGPFYLLLGLAGFALGIAMLVTGRL